MRADPTHIEQVIVNLSVNARDAMPKGGKLTIETRNVELDDIYIKTHANVKEGEYVLLAVTDTGCGIEKDILPRIFDPFFTTKEEGEGTGLGLSTVYGIVRQSGGYIWPYSEPGQGTTLKLYFPRAEHVESERGKDVVENIVPVVNGLHFLKILMVEDEKVLREIAEITLTEAGFKVVTSADGLEALALIEKEDFVPDLIITDVVMPGISGPQMIERIRKKLPDVKVVYISGYPDETIVSHGVLESNVPFIQKPFSGTTLKRRVLEVIKGKK